MLMRTIEVRCCCNPNRLLGYIDLPEHRIFRHSRLVVEEFYDVHWMQEEKRIRSEPKRYVFEIDELQTYDDERAALNARLDAREAVPEQERVWFRPRTYLALKSADAPIEILRKLAGFRETRYEDGSNRPKLKLCQGTEARETLRRDNGQDVRSTARDTGV